MENKNEILTQEEQIKKLKEENKLLGDVIVYQRKKLLNNEHITSTSEQKKEKHKKQKVEQEDPSSFKKMRSISLGLCLGLCLPCFAACAAAVGIAFLRKNDSTTPVVENNKNDGIVKFNNWDEISQYATTAHYQAENFTVPNITDGPKSAVTISNMKDFMNQSLSAGTVADGMVFYINHLFADIFKGTSFVHEAQLSWETLDRLMFIRLFVSIHIEQEGIIKEYAINYNTSFFAKEQLDHSLDKFNFIRSNLYFTDEDGTTIPYISFGSSAPNGFYKETRGQKSGENPFYYIRFERNNPETEYDYHYGNVLPLSPLDFTDKLNNVKERYTLNTSTWTPTQSGTESAPLQLSIIDTKGQAIPSPITWGCYVDGDNSEYLNITIDPDSGEIKIGNWSKYAALTTDVYIIVYAINTWTEVGQSRETNIVEQELVLKHA